MGFALLVAVTHLHHLGADESVRDGQARQLIDWLAPAPSTDAVVAMGDFNADPDEPTYERMRDAGFRSAFLEANGHEPAVTWPSGLQARPWIPTANPNASTTSGSAVTSTWPTRGSCSIGRPSTTRRSTRATTSGISATLESSAGWMAIRLAHRGDWRHAPENSLGSIAAALAVPGCDGVEFDVRLSSDGVPVLLHDETLDRVQGRPGRVDEVRRRSSRSLACRRWPTSWRRSLTR